jgi:4-amino-4-deoxy-L-arabinose transferase-like glycosyltransferase
MFSIGGTNDIVPIYAALLVAIIFSSIAAFVLFRILARFTNNSKIISFALFVYLFNPNLLYNVLNGLETSLVLMFLSLFIFMLIKVQEHVTTQKLITLGVIEGLLALSRLDMVIVVFFGNLFLLQNFLKIDWRQSINYFFISSLTSAIVFLSWAIYNFKTFGMYLTSASITSTFINHRLTYSDNGGYSLGLFIKTILYMLERATQQIVSDSGAPVILLSVFGIGVYYAFKKLVMIDFRNYKSFRLSPVIFVTLGLLALVFVSAGLRWTFRSWYFIPLLIPSCIGLVWVLQKLWIDFQLDFKSKLVQNIFLITLSGGIAFSFFITWTKNLKDKESLQQTIYNVAIWQNENLPPNSHIGVFNAGIQTYFSKHRVTNLDGLINNSASTAMINGTLWDYMFNKEHLDYVSDFDSYMTYRYKDSFGVTMDEMYSHFEKIYTIPGEKDLNVYKVKY